MESDKEKEKLALWPSCCCCCTCNCNCICICVYLFPCLSHARNRSCKIRRTLCVLANPWPSSPSPAPFTEFAWVTLTTNDTYSLGALVLAHSLKRAGTAHQLAVLVTPTVSEAMRDRLKDVYNVVQEVNVLDSQDAANLALLKRPELGVTFTKLHCWRLVQFEKCVFLDADTLVSVTLNS